MGVAYGTNTKDKNNLTPGESYRGQARTWCVIQMEGLIKQQHGHR